MYNNLKIIDNLEVDKVAIVDTMIALESQGYAVNVKKYDKLMYNNILCNIFKTLPAFDTTQMINAKRFYNKYLLL